MATPTPKKRSVKSKGPKTQEDVDALIREWDADPSWNLEDTPGFFAHRKRLRIHREYREAMWRKERRERHERIAETFGVPGNLLFAAKMEGILLRLEQLEARFKD